VRSNNISKQGLTHHPGQGFHVYNATTNKVLLTVVEDQATILHLEPYTHYLFQVQPFTRNNAGKKSNTVPVTTEVGGKELAKFYFLDLFLAPNLARNSGSFYSLLVLSESPLVAQ
jgi:hypothetical protein